MKTLVPLLALLLIGWICGGAFLWYNNSCCTAAGAGTALLIQDGATSIASSPENVLFSFSVASPNISPVEAEFQKLAVYLKDNPFKALVLTGLYNSSEQNSTTFDNLGLARADALKSRLMEMGVPTYQLRTDAKLDENLSFQKELTAGGMNYRFDTIEKDILFSDGTAFSAGTDDNLRFGLSTFSLNQPLSAKLENVFQQIADYLKSNPGRSMKISGLYSQDEENNSMMPNLGMARANSIKNILTDLGVSANQLEIEAVLHDNTVPVVEEELVGPFTYSFFDTPEESDNRLAEVEKRLRESKLILYFETNQQSISLSQEQRQYFSDLIYYLDNKEGARVNSTGHTDNKGEKAYNLKLGQNRAEFARDYLIRNGINAKHISIATKGPDQPVASNESEEGRAKNRRVEISIN